MFQNHHILFKTPPRESSYKEPSHPNIIPLLLTASLIIVVSDAPPPALFYGLAVGLGLFGMALYGYIREDRKRARWVGTDWGRDDSWSVSTVFERDNNGNYWNCTPIDRPGGPLLPEEVNVYMKKGRKYWVREYQLYGMGTTQAEINFAEEMRRAHLEGRHDPATCYFCLRQAEHAPHV